MGTNRLCLLLTLLFSAGAAAADQGPPVYTAIGVVPLVGGVCSGPRVQIEATSGKQWCCNTSKWAGCDVGGGGGGGGYSTVQDEGAALPAQTTLNFAGAGVTCADGGTKTTCTIPSVVPASPANSVQFNNGGAFGGSANFTFDGAAITATGGYYLPTYTRAGSPSCGVTWLSKEIRVHDAGTADETWVCEIDYVGGYNWASYSQVSPAADGALAVVTVGAVFTDTPSGGYCIPSIVSTQAGAAVSGGCQRIVAGGCNTIPASNLYYKQGMMYLAVGYTAQFNRVHLEFGGKPWPMNVVEMHGPLAVPPWTANYPTGHRVYMQGGGPYPLGMWPVGWVTGGSSPQNLSGTRYGTYGTVSGTRQLQGPYAIYYQSNQFTRSGDLKWALSAAQRAAWTMGWNATLGPTPSGVTVGNYYWVLFTYDGGYSTPWTRNTPWEHCTDSVWDPEAISPTTSHFSVLATEVYDD